MKDLGNGLYLPKNNDSSLSEYEFHSFSTSIQGQNDENATSKIFPPEYYQYLIQQIASLQQDVAQLKKEEEKSKNFFKESVLLQRVCLGIIIFLPIVLAGIVATITWLLCSNEQMISLAQGLLGIIGIGVIVDLIKIFSTHSIDQKRLEQIERRLDNLEK